MDRLLATKREGVGLIVRAISFQDFQLMWSQSTNVTDRRTDGRHAIPRPCICTKVHCAVKMLQAKLQLQDAVTWWYNCLMSLITQSTHYHMKLIVNLGSLSDDGVWFNKLSSICYKHYTTLIMHWHHQGHGVACTVQSHQLYILLIKYYHFYASSATDVNHHQSYRDAGQHRNNSHSKHISERPPSSTL